MLIFSCIKRQNVSYHGVVYLSYVWSCFFKDFAGPSPKEQSKKDDKELLTLGSFDPNNVRGQWRTSSDGVMKKYGRHGIYVKASPLASP